MQLSLMQGIDYWVGVPLCFLVTQFEKLRELVLPRKKGPVKKALFIELSEMGSTVIAYPALRAAVERLGAENVYFMIFARNREGVDLLRVLPREHVITIDDTSLPNFFLTTAQAIFRCWRLGLDGVVDLEIFSRCTALLCWLSNARVRVGLSTFKNEGLYRGGIFTHPVHYSPHHHMSVVYSALAAALFEPAEEAPLLKRKIAPESLGLPQFEPIPQARENIAPLLPDASRPLVILNPDPGLLPLRAWPTGHFKALAQQIVKLNPAVVVGVTGVKRSGHLAKEILDGLPSANALDLTGRTANLEELLAVLDHAKVLVTIDSGPAHFSGLVSVHRIVLFGPETPALYGPLGNNVTNMFAGLSCSPCFSAANHRTSVCTNNRCLQEISVASVLAEVQKYL
ncbi:MAG: glycosyltransferase family 9 protein [Proteobacteria bacterium]|nr:glycosyltransferase family 9 protein [Pseudomonadota bacterium]